MDTLCEGMTAEPDTPTGPKGRRLTSWHSGNSLGSAGERSLGGCDKPVSSPASQHSYGHLDAHSLGVSLRLIPKNAATGCDAYGSPKN